MDPQPHAPGDGTHEPIPADAPLPPGSNAEEVVDNLDARIREEGPEEIERADDRADAVEPDAGQEGAGEARPDGAEAEADSGQDPTDDGAANDQPD